MSVVHIYPVVKPASPFIVSWYRGNQWDQQKSLCYKQKVYQAPVGDDSELCRACVDYAKSVLRVYPKRKS